MFVYCACGRSSSKADGGGDSSDEESDVERNRDLQERDEFASRLKKKDEERTRKVMSKSERKVCRCVMLFVSSGSFRCF